ncbi:aminopeptidase N [Shewanella sediminis HAW-EB3]|uniref:Aminopeptidase N n=1 Tax=Shewanella sediminis (strain HAW-EB3) TaxID=425104 RepID=A8FRQ1_SHESH|nr:aminopeptidase N [Shewanella sediminis]ABV35524.1 aminopeptidase N [Shewanella sediminis HAW-EB3]
MNLLRVCLLSMLSLSIISCSSTEKSQSEHRETNSYISQQQAQSRSERVSEVSYQLDFTLTGQSEFSGVTRVNFTLSDTDSPLTLDLNQATIKSFIINGHKIYPRYNGSYFTLNPGLLISGSNTIEVAYTRKHSTNGEGLHRFVDPIDEKVYLYSHFEPAAAQQMFALFDQPDLKASYQLTVTAPKDWVVISAMKELSITATGESNRWHFPASPKLSPYNFSLHAGPYHVWQDNSGKYPLRLFSRQSVAEQVTPEDWFTYTQQGLTFFDDYFGIPYPFNKYDQLLVPDFLYGAMENAAAVTFSENYFLHKNKMTLAQKQSLAGVIMHEMAHQWFGNLVTMKWWNGLWLNESFASFMATLATAEATEFPQAWRSFYAKGKQKAYEQDSRVTTHPIEVPVPTSQSAFDNIDAITYQKGSSVLVQLNHLLGAKVFKQGVQDYLKQYSYQNAELQDFIASLGNTAKRDLSTWSDEWLDHGGVNTIKAEYSCEANRITSFALLQFPASNELPKLREQRVKLGLFTKGRRELHRNVTVPVTYKGARTEVKRLIGSRCPDLVYPNYQDWGYVKVILDDKSFETAKQDLNMMKDPMLRSMLWQSLWDSVTSGVLPLDKYLGTVFINLPHEQDYIILGQVLANLYQSKSYLEQMLPIHRSYTGKVLKGLAQMSLRNTMTNAGNSDFQRRWFDAYVQFSRSPRALAHLEQLLQGRASIRGLTLDQDTRWKIITQLNRYDHNGSRKLLEKEQKSDLSDSGEKAAIGALVSRPEASIKRRWLYRIEHGQALPFSKLSTAMSHLYPKEQKMLSAATSEQRLADLAEIDGRKDPVFMRSYATNLIPIQCDHAGIALLQKAIDKHTELSMGTRRALLEAHQNEVRCVIIKEKILH